MTDGYDGIDAPDYLEDASPSDWHSSDEKVYKASPATEHYFHTGSVMYYGGEPSVATDMQRDYFVNRINNIAYGKDDNFESAPSPWDANVLAPRMKPDVRRAMDRCCDDIVASSDARYMKAVVEEFAKGDYA